MKGFLFVFFLLVVSNNAFSQFGGTNYGSTNSLYEEFDLFFENEIKHQGVKGNWIFRFEEVTGLHKFDFNNDGLDEVLMEFSAVPEEGGGVTLKFAVFFLNEDNNQFKYLNYLEAQNIRFNNFVNLQFVFSSNELGKEKEIYKFDGSKFIEIKN